MPDLYHSLLSQDLGYLLIVAGQWGVELRSTTLEGAAKELTQTLLDPGLIRETIGNLTPQAQEALRKLSRASGRIPWAAFAREFGAVREMGAAKRDRERPYLKPSSTSEALYYHAFLARAFFDTGKGPQEFAYVPEDLFSFVEAGTDAARTAGGQSSQHGREPLGRGATPSERRYVLSAQDRILDDATTLLAGLRMGYQTSADPILSALLGVSGLVKKNDPQAEKVKIFLEAPRREALKLLVEAWRTSQVFNELRLLPGLIFEGDWRSQPRATREFLLGLLEAIPTGGWWSLNAFIQDVKQKYPDYQRPAGDYDSGFVRRSSDDEYLRGYESWDLVDGELIRFFVTSVLYRLCQVDLAAREEGGEVTAFRRLDFEKLKWKLEDAKIVVGSQGRLTAPRYLSRAVRYQLSRFCDREDEKNDEYHYLITPRSLSAARKQGLKIEHLLALLNKHAAAGIPPILVKSLRGWEMNGTEARAETQVVLRVSRPEILDELRRSRAARFLGEPLGPTAVVIKSGAQGKIMTALGELGYLADSTPAPDES